MAATDKQHLLKQAADLFGRKAVADGLKVSETLLDAWIKGDATMPDGQLLRLAQLLVRLAGTQK